MRAAVTILAIVIGLSFVAAVYIKSANKTDKTVSKEVAQVQPHDPVQDAPITPADPAPAITAPADTAPATTTATDPATTPAPVATTPAPTIAPIGKLVASPAPAAQSSSIGSDDPKGQDTMKVELSAWGASIRKVSLSQYTETALDKDPYIVQASIPIKTNGQEYSYYPFAARAVTINGQYIALESVAWNLKSPGVYQLDLLEEGKPAVRITRSYTLSKGLKQYEILCKQNIENLTASPITAVWEQSVQAEAPIDHGSYLGDQRRLFIGYYNTKYDPGRKYVIVDDSIATHPSVLKSYQNNEPFYWPLDPVDYPQTEMVWFGDTNRYFTCVVHRPVQMNTTAPSAAGAPAVVKPAIRPLDELFPTLGLRVVNAYQPPPPTEPGAKPAETPAPIPTIIYQVTSKSLTIAPGSKADLDLSLFAGPRFAPLFAVSPYKELGFNHLIHYELSCAVCTFQWLAKGLLQFLRGIHYVLSDWAMAIVILVLVVRLILHPITKKSQIAMTKMGKQMATLKPEMEKIKAKYADDQTRQNAEIMKLYRERGINPAGMLGCLPMFLQTPIWIALYAMLYFAIELRHEPAFYGVFQTISGGHWGFLADLSSADNFLHFSKSFKLNLIFVHPEFSGINIIPLLMAVFFYLQQALMMPPAANEQQAQQQKIGKYMTLMVPIFLYSAPSGLTLYMLASSIGGMIDGYIVRRHIKQQEADGTLFKPKPPKEVKPGGFMDRIQKALAAQQEKIAQQSKPQQKKKGGK